MKKIFLIFCSILDILFLFCMPSFSFSGWNKINGEFVYLNSKGQKLQNSWIESNGDMYYLGSDGFLVKSTLLEYNGYYYFLDGEGKRIINAFAVVDDNIKTDVGIRKGLYYFDEKGRSVKKTNSSNFKKLIDGIYYAFDEDGLLVSGWIDKEGVPITDPESYLTEGIYYANENGSLYQNSWYYFSNDVGAYSFNEQKSEIIAEDYDYMKDMWLYFDNTCKKIHSENDKAKTKIINGKKYAFDEKGVMVEGFIKNAELSNSQPSNPSLTGSIKLYSFENGEETKNSWTRAVPSSSLSSDDYNDDTYSWFYSDNFNNIVYNKIKTIDNNKYVFDGIGRMKTGFVITYGNGLFVASYKPEELSRDDFIYSIDEGSKLYGADINDLRFFEPGDDNGKMLTGDVKIELEDGVFDFKFRNGSGIALGNKRELKKYKEVYYINGLKLSPIEDMKYGVVKVSNAEYRVVNANGKIVSAKKKLIKDDYDNYLVILNGKLAGYITDVHDKVKLKWKNKGVPNISDTPGYYYYNGEVEVKDYTALAVALGTTCPTPAQIEKIPEEMRLNFR